ncbi:MAG: glycosyltransferase family 4 protein [Solirubrobacteraceae bacterium]|nr:glycosyltransferase family 4 protein [Solirubrobacteraceae bacterium]
MPPVLLVTNHAPADRVPAFAALHAREGIELALFGGARRHGGAEAGALPVPHRRVTQREVHALAAGGRYRAVVAGLAGRVAPLAALAGARRARVPFVLWTGLWAHPLTPAHAASYLPTLALYASANAIATYGPHVSRYVAARGARRVHVAPQAVDPAVWVDPPPSPRREREFQVLFVGRPAPEKGAHVLRAAWPDAIVLGDPPVPAQEVRNFLDGSDVLVVPSLRTRTFREPWGLIVNEAMHRGVPVIASDQVGAAAGGLVRHERNGLVVEAGRVDALRDAIARLRDDAALRARLAENARRDVAPYTPAAWAEGISAALADAGAARGGC